MGDPLPVNLHRTLVNLLDMYAYPDEEVLLLEVIANGIDAKATKINIHFHEEENNNLISIHNNGPPMSKQDFNNYHTLSFSSKTKGQSIGFAGVGAKIFLGSEFGKEIVTITGDEKDVLVSRMYKKGNNAIQYETSLTSDMSKVSGKHSHTTGTTYIVKLPILKFRHLQNNVVSIIQHWFNQRILSNQLSINIEGDKISAWEPKGDKFVKLLKYKSSEIPCIFWICDEEIGEDYKHLVYCVLGKRIKHESVGFSHNIKNDMHDKVLGIIDVSLLADSLTSNKEDFKRTPKVNEIIKTVKNGFHDFLKEHDLISGSIADTHKKQAIDNKLVEKLADILNNDNYKFLGPLFHTVSHNIQTLDPTGDVDVNLDPNVDKPRSPDIFEPEDIITCGPPDEDTGKGPNDTKHGEGPIKDGEDAPLKSRPKRKKGTGIDIFNTDDKDDERECWIQDSPEVAIVYNTAHPLNCKYREASAVYNYHKARVISNAVVLYGAKNDDSINAEKALDFSRDILNQLLE